VIIISMIELSSISTHTILISYRVFIVDNSISITHSLSTLSWSHVFQLQRALLRAFGFPAIGASIELAPLPLVTY